MGRNDFNELDTAALVAVFLIEGGMIDRVGKARRKKAMSAGQRRFARNNSKSGAFRYPRPA